LHNDLAMLKHQYRADRAALNIVWADATTPQGQSLRQQLIDAARAICLDSAVVEGGDVLVGTDCANFEDTGDAVWAGVYQPKSNKGTAVRIAITSKG
jgi:hypothetical protein